jgi:hypothetical protein
MRVSRAAPIRRLSAIAATVLLAAACSSTTPASSSTGAGASASASLAASPSASASSSADASSSASAGGGGSGGAGTLNVTAKEYAFGTPTTVPAGVTTINLQNTGKEEHQAQIVRINDGKTFADLTGALAKGPDAALALVTLAGGPNLVPPGATGTATTDLKPGNYAFLCFISAADGVPHVAKGMIAPVQVTGTSAGGSLPAGDATVTAKDFTYTISGPVAAGQHTFTFTNQGPQPHEAGIIKLNSGVTVDQIRGMLAGPPPSPAPTGPPPWAEVSGSTGIAPGATSAFTANLEAGATYAFICFIPDPKTGKPHAALGMVVQIPTK